MVSYVEHRCAASNHSVARSQRSYAFVQKCCYVCWLIVSSYSGPQCCIANLEYAFELRESSRWGGTACERHGQELDRVLVDSKRALCRKASLACFAQELLIIMVRAWASKEKDGRLKVGTNGRLTGLQEHLPCLKASFAATPRAGWTHLTS